MIIHDPIYRRFSIPAYLDPLAQAPEVRRLSQVRLLNTLTPSLATLGELRRFSHTLGILYLADLNQHLRPLKAEKRAFLSSVLLHDIGTPPFGHLFEYHLKEKYGWSHEHVIKDILWSQHAREDRGHQIFGRRGVAVRKLLTRGEIDLGLVQEIVTGKHSLSPLLFGTLDFDNIDNVVRMNWALGNRNDHEVIELARHLGVRDLRLTLARGFQTAAEKWSALRRRAYEVIVFDPPTVAAQAVLSSALEIALEQEVIGEDDWALTDEELMERLLSDRSTKNLSLQYLGELPKLVYQVQLSGSLLSLGFDSRRRAVAAVLDSLCFLPKRVRTGTFGYTFIDRGTFSKRISFVDPQTNEEWHMGSNSETVVLYAFVRNNITISHSACMEAVHALFSSLTFQKEQVLRCDVGTAQEMTNAQRALDISAS
jgi:hypothetical protein